MYCFANFTSEIYFKIKIKYVCVCVYKRYIKLSELYDVDGVPKENNSQ